MTEANRFICLIPVKNLKRSVEFYTEKLGGKMVDQGPGELSEWSASVRIG